MRLSEAILLGSTVVKAKRLQILENGEGCALGMAMKGSGIVEGEFLLTSLQNLHKSYEEALRDTFQKLREKFPVLRKRVRTPCSCKCWEAIPVEEVIVHLFDSHITLLYDWTLERLCQWVDSVEPKEEQKEEKVSQKEIEKVLA